MSQFRAYHPRTPGKIDRLRRYWLIRALRVMRGNTNGAARYLGIDDKTVRRWIERYNIDFHPTNGIPFRDEPIIDKLYRRHLARAMRFCNGNRKAVAFYLGIDYQTVGRWLDVYGMNPKKQKKKYMADNAWPTRRSMSTNMGTE